MIKHISVGNALKLTIVAEKQEGDTFFVGMALVNNEPSSKKKGVAIAKEKLASIPQEMKNEWVSLPKEPVAYSWGIEKKMIRPGTFVMNEAALNLILISFDIYGKELAQRLAHLFRKSFTEVHLLWGSTKMKYLLLRMKDERVFQPVFKDQEQRLNQHCYDVFHGRVG
jgi:hypothetical protein